MNFPFPITQGIRDAYLAHTDYISAGVRWLQRNDPEGQNEQCLIEQIQSAIQSAAQEHFGPDEDAEYEFYDKFGVDELQGVWYEIIEEELEAAE